MTKIGYAAMLEQFHPTDLLDWCAQAESAGFSAGFMVSEHFHPWTPQQGNAAFAWSFMGALGQRTSLPFGTAVTCPGFRYHPAVIAHAAATLGAMYPGRFWLGLGAGEALNEHVVGGHWPSPDEELEEGWQTLEELKEEGLVRHIGVSNFDVEQLRRAQAIAPVETLQPPYSLVDREVEEEILPFAETEGIGVIVYSPMGSGMLTGAMTRERIASLPDDDWRKRSPGFQEPELTRRLELVARLERAAERLEASPGAVAVAWTLRNPAVDGAIVGFRRPDQVDPILPAAELELSEEDAAEIESG